MVTTKRVVCLANSRKLGARCIAGRELVGDQVGEWIRPVTDREHGKVELFDCRYEDSTSPCVLDIMEVPLLEPKPEGYQQENWQIAPKELWRKVGRIDQDQLADFAHPNATLWVNGHGTYHGINDKIPLDLATKLKSSLRLVRVDGLTLAVFHTDGAFGPPKRRVLGKFKLGATNYWLSMTDPIFEHRYRGKNDGDYEIGQCFLTISLSEPFEGACYKLIAAIIEAGEGGAK